MKVELYDLLPAIYRSRDHELGGPLRALTQVLSDELDVLRRDIDGLYEDWFIETCAEWVVPYVGDLLSASGLYTGREGVFSLRAFVANTLAYRRRKGTASVLENIAQDVSGWSASVTEFFQLLTTAQHANHPRLTTTWSMDGTDSERIGALGNLDIRKERLVASIDTAFDAASHTVDIKPFTQYYGWHNIDRLGIFVWRVKDYPMHDVPLQRHKDAPYQFTFHPLGLQVPLFTRAQRQTGATTRRQEWEVPRVIDRDAFSVDIEQYYGEGKSILITVDGVPVRAVEVESQSIEEWPQTAPEADGAKVIIDVERGRMILMEPVPQGQEPEDTIVRAWYYYGFSADIGGGPYARELLLDGGYSSVEVNKKHDIGKRIDDFRTGKLGARGIIRIMDSDVHTLSAETLVLHPGEELVIEATEEARPIIVITPSTDSLEETLRLQVGAPSESESGTAGCPEGSLPMARVQLRGLMIQGRIEIEGDMELSIEDCTMLPLMGTGAEFDGAVLESLAKGTSYRMEVSIVRSVVGALRLVDDMKHLRIVDSVVDPFIDLETHPGLHDYAADNPAIARVEYIDGQRVLLPGPTTSIERSTIFGAVRVARMPLASDSVIVGQVHVEERQGGCMRYCYVGETGDTADPSTPVSRTPRRYRCQPDLSLRGVAGANERAYVRRLMQPTFSSTVYGQPSYARLSWKCPAEIRTGASNGSAMGVFNHLMEPQRENNLREAVRRYLPFGLESNVIYADEETSS